MVWGVKFLRVVLWVSASFFSWQTSSEAAVATSGVTTIHCTGSVVSVDCNEADADEIR